MKRLLVFKEKHGKRYFEASTNQEIDAVCRKILKERLDDSYWYDEDFAAEVRRCLERPYDAASNKRPFSYQLLDSRDNYEYESFSFEVLETV